MFLGSSCCNIAENSTFARPLDFACRLNPSFHAFAEACATETLGAYVIWMKRLEQGGFHIPQSADGRIELTSRELAAILSGIKPQRYYKRYSKKS